MKPFWKIAIALIIVHVGFTLNFDMFAASKETIVPVAKEVVLEEDMLTFGITNLDEDEIYIEKKFYLNEDSPHFNWRLERPDEIPYIKFIPKHDIVWHYFVKSIPTSFLTNDESLHILEVL